MADRDMLNRVIARKWQAPFKMAVGSIPIGEIADAVITALAHDLRRGGGVPCLPELTVIVEGVLCGMPIEDGMTAVRAVVRRGYGDLHTRLAASATERLLVEIAQGDPPPVLCADAIAQRFCEELIEYQLLAKLRIALAYEVGLTVARIGAWGTEFRACSDTRVAHLARRLASDPCGGTIRAPRRPQGTRLPTEVLLEVPL